MDQGLDLRFTQRFYAGYRRLNPYVAEKVSGAISLVRHNGAYHPSLHTRKIAGNPDGRFRFMNVDDQYRMVAVLEGKAVLFELVGNHDETLKRGADATLDAYEERMTVDPETYVRRRRQRTAPREAPTEQLFEEQPASLQELFAHEEQLADLIVGDLFGALDGYRDGTIEDWMIFLSPLQRRSVSRAMHGPARVTGGPGTGKTVVALHRAAEFARALPPGRRILVTSFVKNIPETLDGLFARLALDVHDRVAFRHIHDVALDYIQKREVQVNPDWNAAKARFDRCYASDARRAAELRRAGFEGPYLWQEVTRVIEGRGIDDPATYLRIERHGRKRAMQPATRALVWELYVEYRSACDRLTPPLADPEWVMRMALDAVRDQPTGRRFDAIVVDEAQDVTDVGLRFLLELLEGGADGKLLLVGDQSQRIYAGGFRLSDAGIDTRGRSFALRECYRSTDEIMQVVAALGRQLSSEDYGEDGLWSLSTSTVRRGSPPTFTQFRTTDEELAWVIEKIRAAEDLDSIAVLAPTNTGVDDWVGRLRAADIASVRLAGYSGRPTPGVKVGTYARSKGLEFKKVFLPGLSDGKFPWGARDDVDSMLLQGSMLYVAMSRARDELAISFTGNPTMFMTVRCAVRSSEAVVRPEMYRDLSEFCLLR